MKFNIRRIETSGYESASQIILSSFRDAVVGSMEPQGVKIFEEFATAEGMHLRDDAGWATYVALDKIRIVGTLHVKKGKHISMLFVLPAFQKQGIGRAPINAADQSERLETVHSSLNAANSRKSYEFCISGQEQLANGVRFAPMQRKAT